MNHKIKISFIIPCYNAGSYLSECIESIHRESENIQYEIILIDDCSSDTNTKSLISLLHRSNLTIIKNSENKGAGYCRNIGLAKATGEYVCFLDADDTLSEGALSDTSFIERRCDIVLFRYNRISDGKLLKEPHQDQAIFDALNKRLKQNRTFSIPEYPWVSGLGTYIWGKIILREFAVRSRLEFSVSYFLNDIFAFWQLMTHGRSMEFTNKPLVDYRINHSTEQLTNKLLRLDRMNYKFVYDHSEVVVKQRPEIIPYFENYKRKIAKKIEYLYSRSDKKTSIENLKYKESLWSFDYQTYIYGTGSKALDFFKLTKNAEKKIIGFIDSDPKKTGNLYLGKPIFHPGILDRSVNIILASSFIDEICQTLDDLGFDNYFFSEEIPLELVE